ncbi:MAG: hypothetical protein A2046_12425 [Bacteroidetes bacterium GWA2_30_7]|nr:MAG: hypothetical protein A2046_12425 [Bacteroidetes bacterium GWA2_30_7]
MDERIQKWLYDILFSIDEIEKYFISYKKTLLEYKQNTVLKRAIERNLEIIGEAVNKILKINPEIQIINAKKIVGLRNQIIHSYDSISDENIWAIIINHIPKLKEEVVRLLKSE